MEESVEDVKFGVLLLGAPGTGKTTFCNTYHEFLADFDRPHCQVNLDPANENITYPCGIDLRDLITLEDAMEEFKLGPNGSMLYCAEFLLANFNWLKDKIQHEFATKKCQYFVFDLPGQVELYSNHDALKQIIQKLGEEANMQMVAVHLVDSSYLYDRYKFLSAMMLSLSSIIGMEMPFINIITKVDLLGQMGRPDMNLMFYQGQTYGLKYLFFDEFETTDQNAASPFQARFGKLTKNLCEMIETYSQVAFNIVDIRDRMSLTNIQMRIDKANGYFMQPQRLQNEKETKLDYEAVEQYYGSSEAIMDLEQKYFPESEEDEDLPLKD